MGLTVSSSVVEGCGQPCVGREIGGAQDEDVAAAVVNGDALCGPRKPDAAKDESDGALDSTGEIGQGEEADDDNYSYEDSEAGNDEKMCDVADQTTSDNAQGFDVEWHRLLSSMGGDENEFDESVLKYEFEAMDINGDGSLDLDELTTVFTKLGITARPYKLMNLMGLADTDKNGTIEWNEFSKIIRLAVHWQNAIKDVGNQIARKKGPVLEAVLEKEFGKIDVNGDGSISREELALLFKNLDLDIQDPNMLDNLILMGDKDGNGTIEWEEFRKMFHVINTVVRLTRPKARRTARVTTSSKQTRSVALEWQKLISEVGAKMTGSGVGCDLRAQFDAMDLSKDGSLDAHELQEVFENLGISLDFDKVSRIVEYCDLDKNHKIDFREFEQMFELSIKWHEVMYKLKTSLKAQGHLNDTMLRRQFCMIDADHSGSIDRDELAQVFKNFKIKIDDDTLDRLLLLADSDGNATIEWTEFRRMFAIVENLANQETGRPKIVTNQVSGSPRRQSMRTPRSPVPPGLSPRSSRWNNEEVDVDGHVVPTNRSPRGSMARMRPERTRDGKGQPVRHPRAIR